MAENPMQPAVDAELAKFDREWLAAHPRALLATDENGDLVDGQDEPLQANRMRGPGAGDGGFQLYAHLKRQYRDEYSRAKKDFIRSNPIIQAALSKELAEKCAAIRGRAAFGLMAAVAMGTPKKGIIFKPSV